MQNVLAPLLPLTAELTLVLGVLALMLRFLWPLVKVCAVVLVALLAVSWAVGALPWAGSSTATRDQAVPVPWAATQDWAPWDRSTARCPWRAQPVAAAAELRTRVAVLHGRRDEWARSHGTTAVVRAEDAAGRCLDVVATETARNVGPEIRSVLGSGELPVWQETGLPAGWQGMHAEQKAVAAAWAKGYRPIAVAASRAFCDDSRSAARTSCRSWLVAAGATLVTPGSAVWAWP